MATPPPKLKEPPQPSEAPAGTQITLIRLEPRVEVLGETAKTIIDCVDVIRKKGLKLACLSDALKKEFTEKNYSKDVVIDSKDAQNLFLNRMLLDDWFQVHYEPEGIRLEKKYRERMAVGDFLWIAGDVKEAIEKGGLLRLHLGTDEVGRPSYGYLTAIRDDELANDHNRNFVIAVIDGVQEQPIQKQFLRTEPGRRIVVISAGVKTVVEALSGATIEIEKID